MQLAQLARPWGIYIVPPGALVLTCNAAGEVQSRSFTWSSEPSDMLIHAGGQTQVGGTSQLQQVSIGAHGTTDQVLLPLAGSGWVRHTTPSGIVYLGDVQHKQYFQWQSPSLRRRFNARIASRPRHRGRRHRRWN